MESQFLRDLDISENNMESMNHMIPDSDYNTLYPHHQGGQLYNNYPPISNMQMGGIDNPQFAQPLFNSFGQPPMVINLNSLTSMLNDNRKALLSTIKATNEGAIEDSLQMLQKIEKNIMFFANVADLQPNSRFILRQERELISQQDLAYFNSKYPIQEYLNGKCSFT